MTIAPTLHSPSPVEMQDIVGWDVATWSEAVRFWDRAVDWETASSECLELGAGGGGLSLWLALKDQRVLCSNIRGAEGLASDLHRRYGVGSRVQYQDIDATDIPYENHFDVVVFKSVLGGIGRKKGQEGQEQAISQIHKALKPGGKLLFAENHRGTRLHQLARAAAWLARRSPLWRYVSIAEMKKFLRTWSDYELHTTGVVAVFGLSEKQRRILSLIDRNALNKLSPESWRYMIYGVATK